MKLIVYMFVLIPIVCYSQDMRVSRKGGIKDSYSLSDIKKITFTDCVIGINEHLIIKIFNQFKNYPNPFTEVTTIELNLSKGGNTSISIYNSQGMLIRHLYNAELSSGIHKITWDGRNNSGNKVNSGLYFYQVMLDNTLYSNKMFLIK